ncbi:Gfo/Idh/MocA family protein [Amycolatopsis cihanbeyliensis]|uniref:Putative dehydrogenase n=1 Tax=Amycolatopsis cihanbeyliensis TaxID=1128664 RepID=A0A542DS00_AMYCI|nr:Gfo/Idh/MocA family oxidoreductase [Amycolatopsis cihanbeyliensis]TQJ05903.1 putative dehydrogenase [Amycolatopsis cihanbeyliensis]
MAPVRIGVLGCAAIARHRMLPAFAAAADTEVAAVASRDAAQADALAKEYDCRAVHGYAALLRDDTVQAVYVPLPAALHADWVEAALWAGKHVLAEKPLTTDRDRSARLFELAGSLGLALMENVMFIHHSQHARVRQLVADDAIGELRAFQSAFAVPRLPGDDIRYRPELDGGALWDTGVYPVRAALHLLGPGLQVVGATLTRGTGYAVHTAGSALLRSPGGISGQLTFGLDHAYRNAYELWGSTGRITVDRAFTPPADHAPVLRLENRFGPREIRLDPDDQVANTVTAFVAAVHAGAAPRADCLAQADLLHEVLRHAGPMVSSAGWSQAGRIPHPGVALPECDGPSCAHS